MTLLKYVVAAAGLLWAASLYPQEQPPLGPILVAPAPKSPTGDNSLIRQAYALDALDQHMTQWKSGMLEEIRLGIRCWCCKELHSWAQCAMNPKNGAKP